MEERLTISEAARVLKVSRQTLYTWLGQEPAIKRQLDKHHTLTRAQLDTVESRHRKKPPRSAILDLQAVDAALTERIETLEEEMRTLKERIEGLERTNTEKQPQE